MIDHLQGNAAAAGLILLLGGCASTTPPTPPPAIAQPAPVISPLGLASVMGRNARGLESQFGPADLDVREGSARKLQFASGVCVLDAYLYPPKGGGEPVVTFIDARLPDGRDIDRASCVAALTRREEAR